MNIPYRTRRALRRLGITALILVMISIVIWLCWVIWLERYVIYSRDGAMLDLNLSSENLASELAVPPEEKEPVAIYINEGSDTVNLNTELTQMSGYYVDRDALKAGIDTVRTQITALSTDIPIMLDVKHINGAFYYSTTVGSATDSEIDIAAMDKLIADLALSDRYLIARLPGLRDRNYGLNNVDDGLFLPSGIGLWMDDQGCYWLNPSASGTMNYLMRIINELRALGFDEVVFTDFRFPDSDGYTFSGDRTEALTTAAELLVSSCATNSFAVSFTGGSSFPLPEGRSRLYLTGVEAADVTSTAAGIEIESPEIHLVFLADSNDTRYDTYSVLRPLDTAH
ncbi:MAG: hypothetical protein IJX67_05150 [Oscillospiraceae bacterium]|nr:hypothetical protein [Oscillospiraceae bacterium]